MKEIIFSKQAHNYKMFLLEDDKKDLILELSLRSSFRKNFDIICETINDMSKLLPEFSEWYVNLIREFQQKCNSNIILDEVDNFVYFSKKYIEMKSLDFNSYLSLKKKSAMSVVFEGDEIRKLMETSTCYKIYLIFIVDERMMIDENTDRMLRKMMMSKFDIWNILDKIYSVIKRKMLRSSVLDRYIWVIAKQSMNETPEDYFFDLFNFFCYNVFPIFRTDKNPITFLSTIVDDTINFMAKTKYVKVTIFSSESLSNIDEVFSKSESKEMLERLCTNDILQKLSKRGLERLKSYFNIENESSFLKFQEMVEFLDTINFLPLSTMLILFPIISKTYGIPQKCLKTVSPKIILLCGLELKEHNLKFCAAFKFISSIMTSYSRVYSKSFSTYNLKDVESLINGDIKIFGISNTKFLYKIFSTISGILINERKLLLDFPSRNPIKKFENFEIEEEVLRFYSSLNEYLEGFKIPLY